MKRLAMSMVMGAMLLGGGDGSAGRRSAQRNHQSAAAESTEADRGRRGKRLADSWLKRRGWRSRKPPFITK